MKKRILVVMLVAYIVITLSTLALGVWIAPELNRMDPHLEKLLFIWITLVAAFGFIAGCIVGYVRTKEE